MTQLSLIVAQSSNRVIGVENDLPWRLSEDLKFFKRTTLGCPIILGRKNYESIGRPLPGRTNIILSSQRNFEAPGCLILHSKLEVLDYLQKESIAKAFIIGGAQIYELFLEDCSELFITQVDCNIEGDVYFPKLDPKNWSITKIFSHAKDEKHDHAFCVEHWVKI